MELNVPIPVGIVYLEHHADRRTDSVQEDVSLNTLVLPVKIVSDTC